MTDDCSDLGLGLEDALREAAAWKRGEVVLVARVIEPMPIERLQSTRRKVGPRIALPEPCW